MGQTTRLRSGTRLAVAYRVLAVRPSREARLVVISIRSLVLEGGMMLHELRGRRGRSRKKSLEKANRARYLQAAARRLKRSRGILDRRLKLVRVGQVRRRALGRKRARSRAVLVPVIIWPITIFQKDPLAGQAEGNQNRHQRRENGLSRLQISRHRPRISPLRMRMRGPRADPWCTR